MVMYIFCLGLSSQQSLFLDILVRSEPLHMRDEPSEKETSWS